MGHSCKLQESVNKDNHNLDNNCIYQLGYTSNLFQKTLTDNIQLNDCYVNHSDANRDIDIAVCAGGGCELMKSNLNVFESSYDNEFCSY